MFCYENNSFLRLWNKRQAVFLVKVLELARARPGLPWKFVAAPRK